jgi:hypothetical protein
VKELKPPQQKAREDSSNKLRKDVAMKDDTNLETNLES